MPYIGISEQQREEMLKEMQMQSNDDLFADVPSDLLLKRELDLEHSYEEWELIEYFNKLAEKNSTKDPKVKANYHFKGAGCYQHHVPSLVKTITGRGEFLTAYTPYQPEVSQGTLKAIFKFQSYVAELSGMEVANASMYDAATALAEAVTMSYRINKKREIFLSSRIHPEYLEVTTNYLDSLGIAYEFYSSLEEVPDGATVALQNPDFYGEFMQGISSIEGYSYKASELFASMVRDKDLFVISVVSEAFALAFPTKPSDYGAQITCGSMQSFGNAPYYGGAQLGFIACLKEHVRQLPGRIVGKTTDQNGNSGYVLTFQTREQHIKRDRATSNICTNQSIHALATAVYLSQLGEAGLKKYAKDMWLKTQVFKQCLNTYSKYGLRVTTMNSFNEFCLELDSELEEVKNLFDAYSVSVKKIHSNSLDLHKSNKNEYLFSVSETHSLEDFNLFLKDLEGLLGIKETIRAEEHMLSEFENVFEQKFDDFNETVIDIPNRSELEVCRYFTKLSQENFSIDTNFYPLGSCTMKYNPKINDEIASQSSWANLHPYEDAKNLQGVYEVYEELNRSLCEITGFHKFSFMPSAGAHGEFAALLMAKKYFNDIEGKSSKRSIVLVPDSAHGTNPASASMAGFKTVSVKSAENGDVDIEHLKTLLAKHEKQIAVFMLTNPNTFGIFSKNIKSIMELIHGDGGLMYYDGANLNAIAGVVRPGDTGFDLLHLNLHKSFSTPHGGGGPGAGPVGASQRLAPYLPGSFDTHSIGRIRSFHGNFNVLLRALIYIKRNGREGIRRIGQTSTLNANYLQFKFANSPILSEDGIFVPKFAKQLCKHEFIVSAAKLKEKYGITALDIAKRLLDKGIHAPTIYFPTSIPEVIMIEPTETEPKSSLDALVRAFEEIILEAKDESSRALLKKAPLTTKFSRFDEVKAVKEPVLSEKKVFN